LIHKLAAIFHFTPDWGAAVMRNLAFICRSVAVFVVLLAIPALSQTTTPSKPKPAARVYLLRGLLNLSPGIDELGNILQGRGINATVHTHLVWNALAEEAIANCKSGRESPIILIGHSLGANAAVYMADRLRQEDVQVSLIVTLDPVVKTTVYGNVNRLQNYYFSNGVGNTVERASGFHGSLQNVDMKDHAELGHVSLPSSDIVQGQIIGDVLAALHGRCH
jgi:hypothetical protein